MQSYMLWIRHLKKILAFDAAAKNLQTDDLSCRVQGCVCDLESPTEWTGRENPRNMYHTLAHIQFSNK